VCLKISYDRRICSHSAECLRNLESVFNLENWPWINPDRATVESVIETVKKCPSGALSCSINGIEHKDQTIRKPIVIVDKDGPYRIEGGVELIGIGKWGIDLLSYPVVIDESDGGISINTG
jgi:uncharacterized Fe-S cluster protein YjdI